MQKACNLIFFDCFFFKLLYRVTNSSWFDKEFPGFNTESPSLQTRMVDHLTLMGKPCEIHTLCIGGMGVPQTGLMTVPVSLESVRGGCDNKCPGFVWGSVIRYCPIVIVGSYTWI